MSRREHPRFPIRLSVRYPSARSLLGDYTRSVGKGGVAIQSERALPVGTGFVFELSAPDLPTPIEVSGKVVWTRTSAQAGKHTLGIEYVFEHDAQRQRLSVVLETILADHRYERQRRHPRIPVSVEVHEGRRIWIMRDLSQGGAMLQAAGTEAISHFAGQRLRLELRMPQVDAVLEAEAVWVAQPYPISDELVVGRMGLRFLHLSDELARILDQIMRAQISPERVTLVLPRSLRRRARP
jgi:uncharacterized protein (TIGR02266 family)